MADGPLLYIEHTENMIAARNNTRGLNPQYTSTVPLDTLAREIYWHELHSRSYRPSLWTHRAYEHLPPKPIYKKNGQERKQKQPGSWVYLGKIEKRQL